MRCRLFTLPFAFLASFAAMAADGDLDPTLISDADYPGYSINSGLFVSPLSENKLVKTLRADDGRLYLVGVVADAQNKPRLSIIKIGIDGQRDYGFGDGGIRTYPLPCGVSQPADAAIDPLGRIWVAYSKCADARVYRFTADGELDISLLGGGFLSVDFPQGDPTSETAAKIRLMPDNGILVSAGIATNGENPALALARYDVNGNAVAGFGVLGVTTMPLPLGVNRIHRVHRTENGRVVVDGTMGNSARSFVVRVLDNGIPDGGFGNKAPGLSTAELDNLIEPPLASPEIYDSVLLRDGSLIQTGFRIRTGTESNRDFMIVKWREDGLLDDKVGPYGHRSYALDFRRAERERSIVQLGHGLPCRASERRQASAGRQNLATE